MDELKKILQQAIEKEACADQLNAFKKFIEQGDELSAWQTALGNLGWLEENGIQVPENLEQLAKNQGKTWHSNGNISIHKVYENRLLHGECKVFYDNGVLCKHRFYQHNKLHGEFKDWYMNGTPWVSGFYNDGLLHGERKFWHQDGSLWVHELWEHGKLIKSLL